MDEERAVVVAASRTAAAIANRAHVSHPAHEPLRARAFMPSMGASAAVAAFRLQELEAGVPPASKARVAREVGGVSSTTVSHVDRQARELVETGRAADVRDVYTLMTSPRATSAVA